MTGGAQPQPRVEVPNARKPGFKGPSDRSQLGPKCHLHVHLSMRPLSHRVFNEHLLHARWYARQGKARESSGSHGWLRSSRAQRGSVPRLSASSQRAQPGEQDQGTFLFGKCALCCCSFPRFHSFLDGFHDRGRSLVDSALLFAQG